MFLSGSGTPMFTVKLLTGIWEGHVPEWHRCPHVYSQATHWHLGRPCSWVAQVPLCLQSNYLLAFGKAMFLSGSGTPMFTVKLLTGIWEGHVPEWHRYPYVYSQATHWHLGRPCSWVAQVPLCLQSSYLLAFGKTMFQSGTGAPMFAVKLLTGIWEDHVPEWHRCPHVCSQATYWHLGRPCSWVAQVPPCLQSSYLLAFGKAMFLSGTGTRGGGGGGGGVLPMWWVIHMCRGFDPLFSLWQDRARSFWGIFLIHQQQSYLLGYKNYQFLQKSIFLAPNSIFSSIFLGPIFSGQRHTPSVFRPSTPPGHRYPYVYSQTTYWHLGRPCSWVAQVPPCLQSSYLLAFGKAMFLSGTGAPMFAVKLLTGIWEGHVPEWHRYPYVYSQATYWHLGRPCSWVAQVPPCLQSSYLLAFGKAMFLSGTGAPMFAVKLLTGIWEDHVPEWHRCPHVCSQATYWHLGRPCSRVAQVPPCLQSSYLLAFG